MLKTNILDLNFLIINLPCFNLDFLNKFSFTLISDGQSYLYIYIFVSVITIVVPLISYSKVKLAKEVLDVTAKLVGTAAAGTVLYEQWFKKSNSDNNNNNTGSNNNNTDNNNKSNDNNKKSNDTSNANDGKSNKK